MATISKKLVVTIKNKWTNSSRFVVLNNFTDIQQAHKFAYYKHTNNLEDIVSISDKYKNTYFTLKGGFRKTRT